MIGPSDMKCKCGCGEVIADERFLQMLNAAELIVYPRTFDIESGYRCAAHNAAVGGAKNSAHLRGEAADIKIVSDKDRYDFHSALQSAGFTRFGFGGTFIHVDDSPQLNQRRMWVY